MLVLFWVKTGEPFDFVESCHLNSTIRRLTSATLRKRCRLSMNTFDSGLMGNSAKVILLSKSDIFKVT